jgi:hypothetical protein
MSSMLNPEHIPIGKLKQAYGLNEQEAEALLSVLWPNGVFPYELWEQAYDTVWKDAVNYNAAILLIEKTVSFPKFDKFEYKAFIQHIYIRNINDFFNELSANIFAIQLLDGISYIIDLLYDKSENIFDKDIKYTFDNLLRIEKENNINFEHIILSFGRKNIIYSII